MNLDGFKSQVTRQGLARNNRWACSIFPPPGMNTVDIPLGQNANLNIPAINIGEIPIAEINAGEQAIANLSLDGNKLAEKIGIPTANNNSVLNRINLYCAQASIPEREIKNLEWREYGQSRQLGIVHEHGKGVTLSYYCSEDLRERFFFERWQDLVFNHNNKTRSYYNDYVSTIEVAKYNAGWTKQTALYKLIEAYPTNIATQTLTYDSGTFLRLDINFKMRYYERLK